MTDADSAFNHLYWDSSFEIVQALIEKYPTVNVDSVGLEQLYRWIIDLPNFVDEPELANDSILNEIMREWYEEVNS